MEEQKAPEFVADNVVVSMMYTLLINGEEIESTDESDPLTFLQGVNNIITGLEKELYGMSVGESKSIVVSPEEGYGEIDPEALVDVPRSEFPDDIPLEVGIDLDIRDEDGDVLTATVVELNKKIVKLDFNHPFAGETLHFDVTIVGLRTPTPEEFEHGHVHGDDFDEEEEDDFDEEFIQYFDDEEK